jgi:hypothetical protein
MGGVPSENLQAVFGRAVKAGVGGRCAFRHGEGGRRHSRKTVFEIEIVFYCSHDVLHSPRMLAWACGNPAASMLRNGNFGSAGAAQQREDTGYEF